MLINQYDWFFANDELIFLIFMITFDRDDSFISDFSERDERFFFAIYFWEESHHSFIFYQFFHRQQSIFQHFHCFFQIVKNDRKLNYVLCDFDYFFRESRDFREHFLFKLRKISVDTNQFERQKRDQSRRVVSMKRKKEKTTKIERICRLLKLTKEESKRFRTSDITEFKNSIAATKFSKAKKEISKIKKTVLIIFFIDLIIDLIVFFFDWMIFFIAAKTTLEFEQFAIFRSKTEQRAHRLFSRAEKLNIHSIFFFRQYKQRVSSFWLFKLYVLRIVFKWIALCALNCRYSNQT